MQAAIGYLRVSTRQRGRRVQGGRVFDDTIFWTLARAVKAVSPPPLDGADQLQKPGVSCPEPFESEPACRSSRSGTSHCVLVFTPSAPAVQILIPAMRALDRGKLVVGFRRARLASCLCERNRDDKPARLVLAHPAEVEVPWDHLMPCPDVDVAQAR